MVDVAVDRGFQFTGTAVDARRSFFRESGEETLHQVEPGRAGGSEVHLEAQVPEPATAGRALSYGSRSYP